MIIKRIFRGITSVRMTIVVSLLLIGLPLIVFYSQKTQDTHQHAASSASIGRYEKYELVFPYSGNYSNPNDPSQADVEGVFTPPSGTKQAVPGFYSEDYVNDAPTGNKSWKVRYAPSELGNYTYAVTLKDATGIKTLGTGSFTVMPSNNHGFVRANGVTYVRDDGTPFFPLGINALGFHQITGQEGDWSWGNGYAGIDEMLKQLTNNGLNFFAAWSCSWNPAPTPGTISKPYARPNIGCDSGGDDNNQMDQQDSALIDYLVDQSHQKDIYLMYTLKHHHSTWDVPHDPIKERYFIARWGYSTNTLSWDADKESATDPNAEKAYTTFMEQTDPYKHLRTTNQWNNFPTLGAQRLAQYNAVFSDPLMTVVNNHDYMEDCNDTLHNDTSLYYFSIFSGTDPRNSARFNKPNMNGEGGLNPCNSPGTHNSSFNAIDTNGVIIKGYAWGTFMSTLCGCTPWWYTIQQLQGYKGLRKFTDSLPVIPASANSFTSYQDTSQATTSDPKLRVIGRKNQSFAMMYIQNTTGTWATLLRDKTTPILTGGTVTVKNMTGTFTVKWFDTDTGANIKSETVTANANGLTLTLPQQITQSIAAFATTGTIPSISPTPTTPPGSPTPTIIPTRTPTPNPNAITLSVTIGLHGMGNAGDNVKPNGPGNMNLKHPTRMVDVTVFDLHNTQVAQAQEAITFDSASGLFQKTVALTTIPSGDYQVAIHVDGFLVKRIPQVIHLTIGQTTTIPPLMLVNGDIDNNNKLDILDYNILASCFGSKLTTPSCTKPPTQLSPGADIDDDGSVGGPDYNLFLREMSVQTGQ